MSQITIVYLVSLVTGDVLVFYGQGLKRQYDTERNARSLRIKYEELSALVIFPDASYQSQKGHQTDLFLIKVIQTTQENTETISVGYCAINEPG
jgi:hypothetical protein